MQNLITLEDDIATKKQELIEKEKELQDALMNGSTGQQTKAMSALQQVKDDLAEMEGLYTEQTDILRSSYQDIDEYNSLLTLSQSNSLEEIKNGLNEYVYQQQRVTDETKDQLDQQLEVTSRNFATRLKMAQDAGYDIGQAELDALMSTKDDFLNAVQAYADAGREVPKALKAGVDENAVLYANALVTMKDKGLIEMKKAESEMESVAENCTKGFANGLLSKGAINKVVAAATKLGSSAASTLKKFFDIHSPSRVMRDEFGKQIPAGVAVGIEDGTGEAVEAAEKMAEDIAEAAAGMDSMVAFAQKTAR